MKFLALVAATAATAAAAPSESPKRDSCEPGSYRCAGYGSEIAVCDALGNWEIAGPCPSGTVCRYLPQDGFELPYCVDAAPEKRDYGAPEGCTPATYACARNPETWADGIRVCSLENEWEYIGDCPEDSHCVTFANGIPYCVNN